MAILHPHLRQRMHAAAFRATHPAEFSDTLIVDGDTGTKPKADERYAASIDGISLAVIVWLITVVAVVAITALIIGADWADVIGWLSDAGDTLMQAAAPAVIWATKATDTGPAVSLRFSHPTGGVHIRRGQVLATYPDGRLRVAMADTGVRCIVHRASVVGCSLEV